MTNSAATAPPEHPATVLRRMFEDPDDFILAPGVYDGLSARVALEVGFDALYMASCPFSPFTAQQRSDQAENRRAPAPPPRASGSRTLASPSSPT
jgi:methylisocitrate lyase